MNKNLEDAELSPELSDSFFTGSLCVAYTYPDQILSTWLRHLGKWMMSENTWKTEKPSACWAVHDVNSHFFFNLSNFKIII